jgi:hypothetical protein
MRYPILLVLISCLVPLAGVAIGLPVATVSDHHTVYWSEDWESGAGLWSASNGVWEVGAPAAGTTECLGSQCAGTDLDGNYPYGTYSRLESVEIDLPAALADDVLWLAIWHWYSNSASYGMDQGWIQLWTADEGWHDVSHDFTRTSQVWTPFLVDITAYAGQTVRLGFLFDDQQQSGYPDRQGPGWFVDEIRIFDGAFPVPDQLDRLDRCEDVDWDGWYPDRGVWQLGTPTYGIADARSGSACLGTNLDGEYPYGCYSRLISPPIPLAANPRDGKLWFSFHQYLSLSGSYGTDQAILQIDAGEGWTDLRVDNWHGNLGGQWTERTYDLSGYAGQTVRLGFIIDDNQQSGYPDHQGAGWYIDDLQFSEGACTMGNPERFENFATSWRPDIGIWEVGVPSAGPATTPSGTRCWGTNLDGNYPYGAYDRLVTPPVALSAADDIYVCFQHWYSLSGSYGTDRGLFQIRPQGGEWTTLGDPFVGSSNAWSQVCHSLAAYAGQTVEFGFLVDDEQQSGYPDRQSFGWYVDDFEIVGMDGGEAPQPPFLLEVVISAGPAELTFPFLADGIDHVVIYGSTIPGFTPSLGTRLAVLSADVMSFTDVDRPGWPETYYRVSVVDELGNESVPIEATTLVPVLPDDSVPARPEVAFLSAIPNPFNPATTIAFELSDGGMTDVRIFDVRGRQVAHPVHGDLAAGRHEVPFHPRELASGSYLVVVRTPDGRDVGKIMLVR